MSRSSRWSSGWYGTCVRTAACTRCNSAVVVSGRSESSAWAAASNSMPSTRAVLSQILASLRPAHGAMLT